MSSIGHARDWNRQIRATGVVRPLATGGTITGRIMDPGGAPLAGFSVCYVDPLTGSFYDCSPDTAADGVYTIASVPAGTYYLDAVGDPTNHYLDTWYPNVWDSDFWRNLAPAAPVSVTDGGTATADFHLQVGARINVTLRDASGAPVIVPPHTNSRGVLTALHVWGRLYFESNGAKYLVNGGYIGPNLGNGTYQTYAAPIGRNYYVEAWPQGLSYLPVFYDGKPTLDAATPIRPASDVPVPITITLSATGSSIQGSFSFTVPQDQILGSVVTLYDSTGSSVQSVNGAVNGSYMISGVPSGNYFLSVQVTAKKSGVTKTYTKFYSNAVDLATATRIALTGAAMTGINVVMDSPADTPPRVSFTATPSTIGAGQSATLTWTTQGATSVQIDQGLGSQGFSGSATVIPTATTTYTLTAVQGANTVTATATVNVVTAPVVNVTVFPAAMLENAGGGGATTSYALTNSGGGATSINLTQGGPSFFTQSPSSFALAPGATQVVTITASAQPAGSYDGVSIPLGSGVPEGLQIPVKLLSAAPPAGTVTADPNANRVDVAAVSGTNPTGSVSFTNHGTATLTGVLSSDSPWIIPQSGIVTIAPGQTVTLTFTIDRSKRPDANALIGSVQGSLTLSFLSGQPFGKRTLDNTSAVPSVSLVKVVDTVQSTVTIGGVPAIAAGEIALFIPGVGHVNGTGGVQFASDVNVFNVRGDKSIDDVKLYYTSVASGAGSAKSTALPPVPGQVSVAVADVVKNVFSGTDEVGTLQIRSQNAGDLNVAATVLTTNNAAGTFGNTIPVFRSDRSIDTGGALVLTGLRKDATTHTNLYIQETAGAPATIQIDFLASSGSTVGSPSTASIDPFKMAQFVDGVPATAVAAVVTNTSTGGGKIAAYATPVDEISSDTWAIADWSQQLGYAPTDPVVVPIAGNLHGANNTFYRTDLAIMNRGTSPASGTLRYVARSGERIDRQITLGAKQTNVMTDVIGTLFTESGDSVGYLSFTPVTGGFAVSSRTFTTTGSSSATFGAAVPVASALSSLATGGTRIIAGLSDAARTTILAARPGTFRTNFALMETTGAPALVRVTFRFTFPAGQKAQGIGSASRDYALSTNQFLLLNSIATEILGVNRFQYGDLTNVEADFQVLSGNGSVLLFTSSVDNATGDSILRTQ